MEEARVRAYVPDDGEATAEVFFTAVREGTKAHYDAHQRQAWAPEIPNKEKWLQRLERQKVFVAEQGEELVGFMTLEPDGCIDLAFVLPRCMGRGVATKLYDAVIKAAEQAHLKQLYTEASFLARSFFERKGWAVIRQQEVQIGAVRLTNFRMELKL